MTTQSSRSNDDFELDELGEDHSSNNKRGKNHLDREEEFNEKNIETQLREAKENAKFLDRLVIQRYERDIEEEMRQSALETEENRIARAVRYIKDAIDGRSLYHVSSPLAAKAYTLQVDWRAQTLLILTVIVHCSLVIWEPPSFRSSDSVPQWQRQMLRVIELVCVLIYLVFLSARVILLRKKFSKKWYNILLCVCVAIMFMDIVVSIAGDFSLRVSRILRPVLFLVYVKKVRQIFFTLVRTLPYILDVVLMIFFLMITYAITALQLFALDKSRYPLIGGDRFNDFPNSLLSLFVLLTSENYPEIMYPMESDVPMIFFITYLVLGIFILLTTLTAVTFNVYMDLYKKQIIHNRITERRGLLAAFRCLDTNDVGFLRFPQFSKFFNALYPKISIEQINLIFNSLDQDNTRKIDIIEFFQLPDVLQLQFKEQKERNWFPKPLVKFFNRILPRKTIRKIVDHKIFTGLVFIAIITNVIVLCLYRRGNSEAEIFVYNTLDTIFLILYVIEALLKLIGYGVADYFKSGWNRLDFFVVVSGCLFSILQATNQLTNFGTWISGFRVIRLVRIFRVLRLLSVAERFRILMDIFLRVGPVILVFAIFVGIQFYVFAILGMELFSEQLRSLSLEEYPNHKANFDSFKSTFFLLFQLLIRNQWHHIMYAIIKVTGTLWSCWYFITFYILVTITSLNILLGLIVETFTLNKTEMKSHKDLLVEIYGNQTDSNPHLWKVKQNKRRRWSRELVLNNMEDITDMELVELQAHSHFDLLKVRRDQEITRREATRYQSTEGFNKKVLGMMFSVPTPRTVPMAEDQSSEPQRSEFDDVESFVGEASSELTIEQLKEIFDKYDQQSSGSIHQDDFRSLLTDLDVKLTEPEESMILKVLGVDDSNHISWDRFLIWFQDLKLSSLQ